MFKQMIQDFVQKRGYTVCRHQVFYRENFGTVSAPSEQVYMDKKITEEILDFFTKIPPFYFDDTIEPLKINGAWKGNLLQGRKQQLEAIKNKDTEHYHKLLENMFRNEMIYAMWEGKYFNPSLEKEKFPSLFLEWMDGFKYLTGRKEEDLIYNSFGGAWGYQSQKGLIKLIDPAQGIKAHNIINYLKIIPKNEVPVLCDLGSGFGGDVEKVARWFAKPMRIILIDIPVNLTTAYAYISMGFKNAKRHLVTDEKQLQEIMSKQTNELEFIFVPTLFVETLKGQKIHLLHNHGSFSEMNEPTINFYLDNLLGVNTDFLIEINSNYPAILAKSHREIASSTFKIPSTHTLLSRTPTWITSKGHRYLNSVYVRKDILN